MRAAPLLAALALAVLTAAGCAGIAGLDDFVPAGGAGGDGVGGGSTSSLGEGGAGAGPSSGGAGPGPGSGGAGPDCADHLLIAELRTRGNSLASPGSDDFVELFNPTSTIVDLELYRLRARAPSTPTQLRWSGAAGEQLGPYEHYLIAGASFDDGVTPDAGFVDAVSLGANVVVFLEREGAPVDLVCLCTTDCNDSDFEISCGGVVLPNDTEINDSGEPEKSLARVPTCEDTDAANDFVLVDSGAESTSSPSTPP